MGLSLAQQQKWQGIAARLFDTFEITNETYIAPGTADGVGDPPADGAAYNVRMAWPKFDRARVANQDVRPQNIKVKILVAELAIEPVIDGKLLIDTTDTYLVIDVARDSANAAWTLQGRLL